MRVWREESEQRLATELAQARQQLINALTAAKSARYQRQDQKKPRYQKKKHTRALTFEHLFFSIFDFL